MRRFFAILLLFVATFAFARDIVVTRPIAPGLTYSSIRRPEGPWEIRVLRLQRDENLVRMDSALACGVVEGVEALSKTIARETTLTDAVVAATNADFFVMAGNPMAGVPISVMIKNGELLMTSRSNLGFALFADGTPKVGIFRTSGTLKTPQKAVKIGGINQTPPPDTACLYTDKWGFEQTEGCVVLRMSDLPLRAQGTWQGVVTEIVPAGKIREAGPSELLLRADGEATKTVDALKSGDRVTVELTTSEFDGAVTLAIGGGPELMRDGQIVVAQAPGDPRHPRTLIGWNEKEILLVTVDGRQAGWSVGMTLHELACLMQELGCTDALNLDGGGSTSIWVRGETMNRPSDGGERRIANSLLLRSTAPRGPLNRLVIVPPSVTAMSGVEVPLEFFPSDEWYNPVDFDARKLQAESGSSEVTSKLHRDKITVSGPVGDWSVKFLYPSTTTSLAELPVRIVDHCPVVEVLPAVAQLAVGETVRFSARGMDEAGNDVYLSDEKVKWEVVGDGVELVSGWFAKPGTVRALKAGAVVTVQAKLGETIGAAKVQVAGEQSLENYESAPALTTSIAPENGPVIASAQILQETGRGNFASLNFDLGPTTDTRAAYLMVNIPTRGVMKLHALVRGISQTPLWLRAAVIDGNGIRQTVTFADAFVCDGKWRVVEATLPAELKQPLSWQSIYVVTAPGKTAKGVLDVDDLGVMAVTE